MSFRSARLAFDNGLTLIDGPNGAGKSSLWDAVSWCLFGKTVREVSGDQVINRDAEKDCYVEVKLQMRGHALTVMRGRKDSKIGNRLRVEIDGKLKEEGTVDLTQTWLISTLGIDFDLFRCTVLFGQGEEFNFINESSGEQKRILAKIMRVDFQRYQATAKEKLKAATNEIAKTEREIAILNSHLGDPEAKFKDDLDAWNVRQQKRIAEGEAELVALKEQREKLRAEVGDEDALKARGQQIKEMSGKVEKKLLLVESSVRASSLKSATVAESLKRHEALAENDQCPTCEAPVDGSKCQTIAEALRGRLERLDEKVREYQVVEKKLRGQFLKLSRASQGVSEERATIHARARAVTDCDTNFRHRKSALQKLRTEANPFLATIEAARSKQREIEDELYDLGKRRRKLNEQLPYAEFWAKAFGDEGIKSFIFDLVCATLTNRTNDALNIMSEGNISVSFDTQKKLKSGDVREKFSCDVNTNGVTVPYENFSGGEKRRISLAVDMALAGIMGDHYGARFNLMVFDECDSWLDAPGRRAYMDLLKSLAAERAVYVVAHDSEFKAQFDEVITVRKSDAGSTLDASGSMKGLADL